MKTDKTEAAGFAALGLSKPIVAAVTGLGYEEPTPIQSEAIPVLLAGRDLMGQAGTGTGKTAAFALPMLDRLAQAPAAGRTSARALILVPTRELAMQVAEAVHKYGKGLNLSVVPLYGGAPMDQQIRGLRRGAAVVVATPGRALDHVRRQTLDLSHVEVLVLDEADEMLDMGFAEDIDALITGTPETRQTALFAATFAPRIAAIAGRHLKNPARITIAREKRTAGKLPRVRQVAYIVSRPQKTAALNRVLDFEAPRSAIVFCRTRLEVDELTDTLNAHGYGAQALHGGMMQKQRDRVMQLFRSEQAEILVATDVAARGLDIDHVSHVINYDVPTAPEVYVHRIGRTGRIGRDGVAITLAGPREHRFLRSVEALTKQPIEVLALPSLADLRARRLEATRDALRAQLAAGGFEDVRALVESLVSEHDVLDIAAAAVKMAHEATDKGVPEKGSSEKGAPDEVATEAPEPRGRPSGPGPRRAGYEKPAFARATAGEARYAKPSYEPGADPRRRPTRGSASAPPAGPMAVLHIGVGKRAGVGPGDLVGAITGEADVPSSAVGAIRVADDFALVEVPESLAAKIMAALRATKIRGQRVAVSRDKPRES
jgi:ATP-dependent RNA helicase DeaD